MTDAESIDGSQSKEWHRLCERLHWWYPSIFRNSGTTFKLVMDRLTEAELKLKPNKCLLVQNEVSYSRHVITYSHDHTLMVGFLGTKLLVSSMGCCLKWRYLAPTFHLCDIQLHYDGRLGLFLVVYVYMDRMTLHDKPRMSFQVWYK